MNVCDHEATPLHRAYQEVCHHAEVSSTTTTLEWNGKSEDIMEWNGDRKEIMEWDRERAEDDDIVEWNEDREEEDKVVEWNRDREVQVSNGLEWNGGRYQTHTHS